MFEKPASATGITWEDHKGKLLLIEPKQVEDNVPTSFGDKQAVRADITVVDGPESPIEFHESLIFPGVLISQTRPMVGKKVLGRLGQGQAKQGQRPPWRLDDPSDDDIKQATAYIEKRQATAVSKPAETTQSEEPPF